VRKPKQRITASHRNGPGVAIHTAIAITAMLGFLLSELMDELEFLVKRLAKIRRAFFE
jgi:hypothetical protein